MNEIVVVLRGWFYVSSLTNDVQRAATISPRPLATPTFRWPTFRRTTTGEGDDDDDDDNYIEDL